MNAIKVLVSYIFVNFSNRVVAGAGDGVGRDGDGWGCGWRRRWLGLGLATAMATTLALVLRGDESLMREIGGMRSLMRNERA